MAPVIDKQGFDIIRKYVVIILWKLVSQENNR